MKNTKKIFIKSLVDGDIILEEVDASSIQGFTDCALVHHRTNFSINGKRHSSLDQWVVYDTPTGLLIVYGRTKQETLEKLVEKRFQMEEARKTQLYEKRIQEFERLKEMHKA